MPVAGKTGDNLKQALGYLQKARPDLFSSMDPHAYRITNAFSEPRHMKDHGRSEAKWSEINTPANLERLWQELEDCTLVVLCGAKAQSIGKHLLDRFPVWHPVTAPHIGFRGLNTIKDVAIRTLPKPEDRTAARLAVWSQRVLEQLPRP